MQPSPVQQPTSQPTPEINTTIIAQPLAVTPVINVTKPQEKPQEKFDINQYNDILSMDEKEYPTFTLAKNKARFLRMVNWYKSKQEWLEVAPVTGVLKLFKQQSKELDGIRASKMDYEMELEMDTLTPSQRSYRLDELKMCQLHERMAVALISKMQVKIKSGRR